MPLMTCSGVQPCERLISVSVQKGGNPSAKAEPEAFAAKWTRCRACRLYTCDRCLARQKGRCRCGVSNVLTPEAEQIRIAGAIISGDEDPGPSLFMTAKHTGGGPPARAAVVPASPQPTTSLPKLLADYAGIIDEALVGNNRAKAAAAAAQAALTMRVMAVDCPPKSIQSLVEYGEKFFAWRLFAAGADYFNGLYQHFTVRNIVDYPVAILIRAIAGCYELLGGSVRVDSQAGHGAVERAHEVLGEEHLLVRELMCHVVLSGKAGASATEVAAQPAQRGVRFELGPKEAMPMWVTLAFLEIAASDGEVTDDEVAVWKQYMTAMKLPDVWSRYGTPRLLDWARRGLLQELSTEYAELELADRQKLMRILMAFVAADGNTTMEELRAVQRITSWIGLVTLVKIGDD